MKRFCYRCGALEADAGSLINGLCQRCFAEGISLLRAPREVDVLICKRCGAYMLGKRWNMHVASVSTENAIREVTLDSIRVVRTTTSGTQLFRPRDVQGVKVTIEPDLKHGIVNVAVQGKVHELQVRPKLENVALKMNLTYKTCDLCSLKRAGYHEAILQVRDKLPREKLSKARRSLENLAREAGGRERGDFISKVQELPSGLDLYVSSVKLARQMASLLRDEFGASISESAKLVGQTRDGRQRFKVTIVARLREKG